jgi:hypothetical protein
MTEEAVRVRNWEWPALVMDHHVRVTSDRKWPKTGNCLQYSFITINRNEFLKYAN